MTGGFLRKIWPKHRRAIVAGAAMLGLGMVIGVTAGRVTAPKLPAPAPIATSDPPATETSQHTVVEDEPVTLPAAPAEPQVASLPPLAPPSPPALPQGQPAWERFAVASPDTGGRPEIALIIDDMGLDKRRSERVLQLPGPLTISFMTYAEDLARQTEEAHARGHELMMHVPMEPLGEGIDPGPGALLDNLSLADLRKQVDEDLARFDGYVGINNHMGSKFTAYAPGMQVVMEELRRRGLLFIDSLTTDHSVGLALAQRAGVPTAGRNVFLDNEADLAAVNAQLSKLEEIARKKGNAIAIGHPRDATIAALAAWLPTLARKGLVLVPVTAVVRARQGMMAVRYSRGQETPVPPSPQ